MVRLFWPGSFLSNFQGELFRLNWSRLFRPSFKHGSFQSDSLGEVFPPCIFYIFMYVGMREGDRLREGNGERRNRLEVEFTLVSVYFDLMKLKKVLLYIYCVRLLINLRVIWLLD